MNQNSTKKAISFGEHLKELRKSRGYTQLDVAEEIGINPKTYGHYETEKSSPSVYVLKRLAKFYGITVDCLIDNRKYDASENINLLFYGHSDATKEHICNLVKFVMKEFKL